MFQDDGCRRVLLVDDEVSVCDVVSDMLQMFSPREVELTCVSTDTAAYRALVDGPPFDPILVDINLGHGTTGYDVARRARTLQPNVDVVYISGQIDARSVAAHGVPDGRFLPKPFTSEQLLAAIGLAGNPDTD